jgi:hypothetical protein
MPCPFISTRKKQQLPTPHRHHSRPEMDSMPGRSTRHQPSSLLLGLPQDLCIEIAARVDVTSERPLANLRSLRGTCSTMRRVWGHGVVDRRLSIKGIRDEISWVWNPTAYKAFLAMLSGLGNPEACFLSRIKAFFIKHRGHNDLRRAAEGGCDAPGFQPELLTLMSRSTVLTLVKRRSTWAITSKTSPTNPNDPFGQPWSTLGQTPLKAP